MNIRLLLLLSLTQSVIYELLLVPNKDFNTSFKLLSSKDFHFNLNQNASGADIFLFYRDLEIIENELGITNLRLFQDNRLCKKYESETEYTFVKAIEPLSGDLNQNANLKILSLYLCYQRITGNMVLDDLQVFDNRDCFNNYSIVRDLTTALTGNLNEGAYGAEVFLCAKYIDYPVKSKTHSLNTNTTNNSHENQKIDIANFEYLTYAISFLMVILFIAAILFRIKLFGSSKTILVKPTSTDL